MGVKKAAGRSPLSVELLPATVYYVRWLLAVAEEAEQVEEQVDEIEVERQRAYGGELAGLRAVGHGGHLLDFLRVPCGEADEYHHACEADNPLHRRAFHENVDNGADNEAYQCHEQECANARQVALGHVAVNRHGAEHGSGDDKCGEYRTCCVCGKDCRQHHAVEYGVDVENERGNRRAELVQRPGEDKHENHFGYDQPEVEARIAHQREEHCRNIHADVGCNCRDNHGKEHLQVDALHYA